MDRILLVSGSLRRNSTNTALLLAACDEMPDGYTGVLYGDMRALPHFDPDDDVEPLDAQVVALRAAIGDARAVVFSTPEYAGALPGSFKNLLDWTIGGGEIYGKPVAWWNASTSPTGAAGAHASLRAVLGYAGTDVVVDACAHIPVRRDVVSAEGVADDPDVRAAVRAALATLADRLRTP
ncbi:MAG TPA: NADPH-dependent FMN reductase [Acidimicrobiia bacterium]|nr:NADPH-dependent FMN reductase [Acidimicrobiia bacterium]